ncbi:MAG: RDD family protein [Pyrinomonadaceae bacterium]
MINDSVREELKDKISPIVKKITLERTPLIPNKIEPTAFSKPVQQAAIPKPQIPPVIERVIEKQVTMEIAVKPTAPTLVEFQNKNATVPEWRMQLKNSVLKRQNRAVAEAANTDFSTAAPAKLVTSGANALKVETLPEPAPVFHKNPTVNNALQRIQQSRRQFLVEETPQEIAPVVELVEAAPAKSYPFRIAAKAGEVVPVPVEVKPATINQTVKPRAATPVKAEKVEKFDTNKLPPLPVKVSASFDIHSTTPDEAIEELEKTEIKLVEEEEIIETEVETEEIEDLAPFAMRFNAGLFDLIIGSFLSFIMLIPFMVSSGSWLTPTGILTFAVTCAVVMFIYMTVSIGFYGRTFGMRIFALEVVDIEGEEYPTIHQAAVSSCLYLLSLAMGGIGFLTLPFNSEKRAVHDLASGTIVVREM